MRHRGTETEHTFQRMVLAVQRTLTSAGNAPPVGAVMWALEYELPVATPAEREQFATEVIEEAKRRGRQP